MMDVSRPDDVKCPDCGALFSPSWDRMEGRWEFTEISEAGICHQCRKLRDIRQNIEACLQNTGVLQKYLHCSLKNFQIVKENSFCVNACNQYLANHSQASPGLYLYGNCGTGKTHLAIAIIRELLLKGKQVVFTCGSGLCFDIKKAFKDNDRITEYEAIQPYILCEYLVMDDLGGVNPTEWDKKTIGYIIDERDSRLKPTIITSNFSLDELADHIGQRTASRIAGMSQIIRIPGPDWRLKKKPKN